MTEKDYLKKYDIRIIILSRGRYNTITTTNILPDWIEVLVPESEYSSYKQRLENPLLTIPDEIEGLGAVRNWVLDNFKERTIIMLDDDIKRLYSLTGEYSEEIDDKEEVVQVLINTAVMANDMGVKVFGYNQTDIRKYNATEPFRLSTWIGGVIGVIGRRYRFRQDKFKVDIDYCLQNLLDERILLQDARYLFSQLRDNNIGGNSIFRTEEGYNKSVETLKRKWGDCIKVKNHKGQLHISLNVARRQKLEI